MPAFILELERQLREAVKGVAKGSAQVDLLGWIYETQIDTIPNFNASEGNRSYGRKASKEKMGAGGVGDVAMAGCDRCAVACIAGCIRC